jgi:hypothetical protein
VCTCSKMGNKSGNMSHIADRSDPRHQFPR